VQAVKQMAVAVRYPLNVAERIHLIAILPLESDVTTLRIVRELRESLSLSEEEHKEFQVETIEHDGQITYKWGNLKAAMTPREIEFRPKALAIVAEAFKRLNQTKRMRAELLPLYETFVEEKE
jgi:hypothetical protein